MIFMTVFSKKKKATHTCNIILKTVNASEFIVSTNSVACIAWWFPISSHFHCPLLTHLGLIVCAPNQNRHSAQAANSDS